MHLTQLARQYGDKPAVIMGGSGASLTYAELERQSNQIAQLFRSRGLRPGDHIAVLMENRPEFFPVAAAAAASAPALRGWLTVGSAVPGVESLADAIAPMPGTPVPDEREGYYMYYSSGPLYHAAPLGWSLGTIRNGGTVVVMERFDAARALARIERYRVTRARSVSRSWARCPRYT